MASKIIGNKSLSSQFAGSFADQRTPVVVKHGGEDLTLYVREIGYLEKAALQVNASQGETFFLAALLAATVEDKDGNRFTYDEVLKLREDVSKPLFNAVIEVNRLGAEAAKN
jgi:hypothetical protein